MQLTRPQFDDAEIEEVRRCLASGWVTQGPMVAEFEKLLAVRQRVPFALATTSCTAALHLSTMALGLGPGDEVVVPAFTWVTSAHCAEYCGARAVFADIDLATYNLDPKTLEAAITPRTRAVVAVHLFGQAAPMHEIQVVADRHGLKIIEDCACAIGTEHEGVPVGGLGVAGCFSFHPRKIITTGEGGLVTTNDAGFSEKVQCLRNHGATGLPPEDRGRPTPWSMANFDRLGYNLRLSDIQAAVGVAQLAKLDTLLTERRRLAANYDDLLRNVEGVVPPHVPAYSRHTYQSYVIRIVRGMQVRNRVMSALAVEGIQTRPGTHAVHRLGYYRQKYGISQEQFPQASLAEDTTITLPLFPGMRLEEQARVIKILGNGLSG